MKFSLITSALTLASAVVAAPARRDWTNFKCLSQSAADTIVTKFISVLAHTNVATANATAQALFSDTYTEVSDSILSLEGLPVCSSTSFS